MDDSMLIGGKSKLLSGILAVVLVTSIACLLFPSKLKISYAIDGVHLAEAEPQGTWENMICPQCGSRLERIVIDPDDPQIEDDAWRFACYCRHEDIFWVSDFPGGISPPKWHGPFDAHWRLTNVFATAILIISGVALVFSAMKGSKIMGRHVKI